MSKRKRRTTDFTEEGIRKLPKDKPAVYEILNARGTNVYTGSVKRGRVDERLREHLPGGPDPIPGGRTVKIEQKGSIGEAQKAETRIIKRSKPRHNKRGK